ncbi:unnamed protein product [Didymodactylos carnosus]|uniref:Uncharacterized protein n=1 Tax=Didymodactylos carnosus TaxID=1234261 RepID=A0A814CKU5_9BILA|nr:unnamed protein product [Didymodactylos carnosus]CAF3719824.1 unnamed protein product [Didymodactylos carnosus]
MAMRPFVDASFNNCRYSKIIVQELSDNTQTNDFQRFFLALSHHKHFYYKHYKLEYRYLNKIDQSSSPTINDIQPYRRPIAFILFAVCNSIQELTIILEQYDKITQQYSQSVAYIHLFIKYKSNIHLENGITLENARFRTSISSLSSRYALRQHLSDELQLSGEKLLHSSSVDDDSLSDNISLSSNSLDVFRAIADDEISLTGNVTSDSLTSSGTRISLIESFDDEIRTLNQLSSRKQNQYQDSTNSMNTDPLLDEMKSLIISQKITNVSFLTNTGEYLNDKMLRSELEEFDKRLLQWLLEQLTKINSTLLREAEKSQMKTNSLSKKNLEARYFKRKGDYYVQFGNYEKGYYEFKQAIEALKSLNDPIWFAAAIEGLIACSYLMTRTTKNKRHTIQLSRQPSLTQRLSSQLAKFKSPMELSKKLQVAINGYHSSVNGFYLEIDLYIKWCKILIEYNYERNEAMQFIAQISVLAAQLNNMECVYCNALIANLYDSLGLRRKSALYNRVATLLALKFITANNFHHELPYIKELIKKSSTYYGIQEKFVTFPLIQKTVVNESIMVSARLNDYPTIVENVYFALEYLIDYMSDNELNNLLYYMSRDQTSKLQDDYISCAYCNIPKLCSLKPLAMLEKLKPFKFETQVFIYHYINNQKQRRERKVDFLWVKDEYVFVELIVENYLPINTTLHNLKFLTDNENQLLTDIDTKYEIPSRTTKKLTIRCIPNERLTYHVLSTQQEFRFIDYPTLHPCLCSIDVVDPLPILTIEGIQLNENKIHINNNNTINTKPVWCTKINEGQNLFIKINISSKSDIEYLEVSTFAFGSNITDDSSIIIPKLPILAGQTDSIEIHLSDGIQRSRSKYFTEQESSVRV